MENNAGQQDFRLLLWICGKCSKEYYGRRRKGPDGNATLCNKCGLRYWRSEQRRKAAKKLEEQSSGELALPPLEQQQTPAHTTFFIQPLEMYTQMQSQLNTQMNFVLEIEKIRFQERIMQLYIEYSKERQLQYGMFQAVENPSDLVNAITIEEVGLAPLPLPPN